MSVQSPTLIAAAPPHSQLPQLLQGLAEAWSPCRGAGRREDGVCTIADAHRCCITLFAAVAAPTGACGGVVPLQERRKARRRRLYNCRRASLLHRPIRSCRSSYGGLRRRGLLVGAPAGAKTVSVQSPTLIAAAPPHSQLPQLLQGLAEVWSPCRSAGRREDGVCTIADAHRCCTALFAAAAAPTGAC